MLNPDQKLNPNLFDLAVEQRTTREGFGEALVELAEKDSRIVALSADLRDSTRLDLFAKRFPERLFEVGVAEQNLAGVASGLAAMGKIPFLATYAVFSPGRNWEQIRTTICYNNVPVKLVGAHSGLETGPDGGSHEALEDIALTRVLPRMTVVVVADYEEAKKATHVLASLSGPTYLRLVRDKVPMLTSPESPFILGQANILWRGENPVVTIVACGSLVYHSLLVAKKLAKEGINVLVVNNHTIKPLDTKTIGDLARETGAVVTVEDHQQAGGLGGAVAEFLVQHQAVPTELVGVKDCFGQTGTPAELIEHYDLGVEAIMTAVKKVLERKNN